MIAMRATLSVILENLPTTMLNVTIVLAAAQAIAVVFRHASAASRHLVWLLALGSCLVLAVATPAAPRATLHVPAVLRTRVEPPRIASAMTARVRTPMTAGPRAIPIDGQPTSFSGPVIASGPQRFPSIATALPVIVLAWALGFIYVVVCAHLGQARIASIIEDGQRVTSAEWRDAVRDASIAVGFSREIEVLESDKLLSPVTSGFLNPVIIVPTDARGWGAERRHIVLVHELAHIARFDYLAQRIATAACALFWFHPLIWLGAARLRAEAEHAADDRVLKAGTAGVTYASHLLALARQHSVDQAPIAAIGMVRSSRLEARCHALLDPTRSRAAVSRVQGFAAALTLCAMVPAAGVRVVASRRAVPASASRQKDPTPVAVSDVAAEPKEIVVAPRPVPTAVIATGISADSLFESTLRAAAGDRLRLDLRAGGAVVIHGWDEPRIRVVGRLAGHDWRDTRVSLQRVPEGIRLRSEMMSIREEWQTSHEFEIWAPRQTSIQLSSAGGSLAITGLSGDFYGDTGGGGIAIDGATGSAHLATGGGDISIANSRLSGTVYTGGGELTVTNVTGGLRGRSGTGSVIVSNADGSSTVRASDDASASGRITVPVAGSTGSGTAGSAESAGRAMAISKDGGDIVIDRVPDGATLYTGGGRIAVGASEGAVSANTGGGDIELENVGGDATATTGSGEVRIRLVNGHRRYHGIDVTSGKGRVVISIPSDLDARIDLETAYTNNSNLRTTITSDFSLERTESDQWDGRAGTPRKYVRATGVLGNGRGLIRVRTVNGDVVLRRVP